MTDETRADAIDESLKHAESAAEAERRDRKARKRGNRLRTALALILALLVLLLLTLSAFVVRLMTPVGSPDAEELSEGMEWVRSMYGWGKKENQQLYGPTDVAIAPDGAIWVNDPQRFQLIGFNPDGSYRALIHKGPGYMVPQAFDISEDGDIYIADFGAQKIRVFTADNQELRSWDSSLPTEVAVRGDRVVVGQRDRVVVYDTQGKLIQEWGTRGKARDQVDIVRGVAIGPDETIYISDTQNSRIKAFSMDGKLKWVYPSEQDFKKWADDAAKGKKPKRVFQIPTGMTLDAAGRLVLVDPFEFKIMVVDPKTGKVTKTYGDYGEKDGKFAYPTSIAYDRTRDWFAVADTANNRVQIVRIEGSGGGPLSGVARMAVGPVWVCSIPLILLLIAAFIAAMRRRAAKRSAQAEDGSEEANSTLETASDSADTDSVKVSSD